MLQRTWEEFQYGFHICRGAHGLHIDHLVAKPEVLVYVYQVISLL